VQIWKVVAASAELPVESLEYNAQSNFEYFKMSDYTSSPTPQAENSQGVESCRDDLLFTLTIYLPVKLSIDLLYSSKKLLPFQSVGEFHDERFSLLLVQRKNSGLLTRKATHDTRNVR